MRGGAYKKNPFSQKRILLHQTGISQTVKMEERRRCEAYKHDRQRCLRLGRPIAPGYIVFLCGTHTNSFMATYRIVNPGTIYRFRRHNNIRGDLPPPAPPNGPIDDDDAVVAVWAIMEREMAEIGRDVRIRRPAGEMEKFVNDNQNVHTTVAVKQTLDIVKRVLTIKVPDDYKWNTRTCSKTPGEVIAECGLSINSSRMMMDKYTRADNIYELGEGIYGRVLDCVWQYIKTSKDKKDMCAILKQELEDNVGMCLQGNLSRLCNALAGYMAGVSSGESIAEVLGREFPKLWDIDDEDERIAEGNKILDRMTVVDKKVREEWIASLY